MKQSIRIFRLFGINIDLHYSWFLVVFILAWGLSSDFFPANYPGLDKASYWSMGIIAAIMLFASVLIHEMSHSLTAKNNNIPVDRITLFFFGGIASIGGEDKMTPKKEFLMAIAGPLASLFLSGVFFLVHSYFEFIYIKAISLYLYKLNFMLAVFNLAPGYPLDGGRVLRSIVWGITKDIKYATKVASSAGRVIAGAMIIIGVLGMFIGAGTLWFIILGLFLYAIAGASYDQVVINSALKNVKVKEVMAKNVRAVSPDMNLAELFQDYFLRYGAEGVLVAKNKVFLGIATIESLKTIPKAQWPKKKVKEILIPASKIPSAKETDNALQLLTLMSKRGIGVMPVIKNKKLAGAISADALMRYSSIKDKVKN